MKTKTKRTFPAEPLTPSEVKGLLAACSPRSPTGLRNRALIVILWRAGLRSAEARALEPRDLEGGVVGGGAELPDTPDA
jgi:integrase/recombinase XerD